MLNRPENNNPESGISILLCYDADTIAETLATIEQGYFVSVGWNELLEGRGANLQNCIDRFNGASRWFEKEAQKGDPRILSAMVRIAFVS